MYLGKMRSRSVATDVTSFVAEEPEVKITQRDRVRALRAERKIVRRQKAQAKIHEAASNIGETVALAAQAYRDRMASSATVGPVEVTAPEVLEVTAPEPVTAVDSVFFEDTIPADWTSEAVAEAREDRVSQ